MVKVISAVKEMQERAGELRRGNRRIACVPTMGFLHDGHLSLMRMARQAADSLVVSIFVNPAQFGPGEDFETYPRDLDRDLGLCAHENVDIVFTPETAALYPEGYQSYVKLEHLPHHLCGLSRPVFFTGVATVVCKLFNIVRPHSAVFGEKDYQQLLIIRRMVKDLNFNIDIIGAPIVREKDGLAMSSRNAYLKPGQRPAALTLYRSLVQATRRVETGERDATRILQEARDLIAVQPETEIDYLSICDPESLVAVACIDRPALMALAVKVGKTRLIDNTILPGSSSEVRSIAVDFDKPA
ncbi:MAG: pantoate--beta-alanine ligase [Deltaproteobacteria bacterium]|nr:pantoate--beta-alanine ligase [Deltaproteobacteria bacterium]